MDRLPIVKIAEAVITPEDIRVDAAEKDDPEIIQYFKKTAADLKAIAPKAKDFLYFTCIMMHAAEAALLDEEGNVKKTSTGEDLSANWDQRKDGAWVWNCNDASVMPYKNSNCFVPGTEILLGDGSSKKIEDIQVGDEVFTHKNRVRKVTALSSRPHSGKLLRIKSIHNPELLVTGEHPFYKMDISDPQKKKLNELVSGEQKFKFEKAAQLVVGDVLLSPVNRISATDIEININRARLLGLFTAEGSFSKKYGKKQGIVFTFGIKEQALADLTKELFDEEFPECSVTIIKSETRSVINVRATGAGIAEFFYHHCGEYSNEKKLSKSLVFGTDDVKRAFLLGWLEGDGCITTGNKIVGVTTSPHLAWQTRTMLSSLGLATAVRVKPNNGRTIKINDKYGEYKTNDSYRVELSGKSAYEVIKQGSAKYVVGEVPNYKNINYFLDDYRAHRITDIEEIDYNGKVYNFAVEDDNSYIANGVIVHNCDIFPEQELKKAYNQWIGKPLCLDHQSSSVEMIRGVIVDTVYDEKKKRIIALCALDKKNYPDLARKVASGYAASVSMGTAVGRAICTEKGCHRVARVESDFCEHMRAKSGYGEINVDLSPIELSLVVNGADPKAKIRRIIAAADTIADYVDKKAVDEAGDAKMSVDEASDLIKKLEANIAEIKELVGDNLPLSSEGDEADVADPPYGQPGRGSLNMAVSETSEVAGNSPQAPGSARYAQEVSEILDRLREKVGQLDNFINKMASVKESNNNTSNEDTKMANEKRAYFQGGGGVNEPTPGQVKYPKEDADSIRNNQDKQLNGQMDTGPVDGMHPGYDSFGESEEERKRRLQRLAADAEGRKIRREAAMDKAKELINQKREAYFQGGGDVNEPTPGKPKYPKEDSDSIRDKEDKQQVGAPPFPGVGKTTGLYGDDEATKKKLLRAKLNARFVKAANPDGSDNLAGSRWDIYEKGDSSRKLVLSATVEELVGMDRVGSLYSAIATKEYGSKMIETIRSEGLAAAHNIFKSAQVGPAAAGPAAAPAAPVDMGGAGPAPADAGAPAPGPDEDMEYGGETGSPVDQIRDISRELGNLQADLEKAVDVLDEEGGEEMGSEMGPEMGEVATTASVSLPAMGKLLGPALKKGLKQASAEIEDVKDELKLIENVYSEALDDSNASLVSALVKDARADVNSVKKNAYKMMASFVRYARGTDAISKMAQFELPEEPAPTPGPEAPLPMPEPEPDPLSGDEGMAIDESLEALLSDDAMADDLGYAKDKDKDEDKEDKEEKEDKAEDKEDKEEDKKEDKDDDKEDDKNDVDGAEIDMNTGKISGLSPDELTRVLTSMNRADRDALRVKLAQQGVQFSDMLQKAHPGGGETTDLDVKPEGDLAKVETLPEAHDKFMDVANAPPRNIRNAAEKINMLVTAGEIDPEKDFPALIAEGLDPQAVAYWKSLWGQAKDPEASKFVTDLVKDYNVKKASDSQKGLQTKIARAYELAYGMAERGLLAREPSALRQQVDKILNYSDENFEHLKHTIARLPVKQASVPQVGVQDSALHVQAAAAVPMGNESYEDLTNLFEQAFNGRKY